MTTVVRMMPMETRPYMFFSPQAPYFSITWPSGSESSGNESPSLPANLQCESIESLLMPSTSAPSARSSGNAAWNSLASVVHPGVSSLG